MKKALVTHTQTALWFSAGFVLMTVASCAHELRHPGDEMMVVSDKETVGEPSQAQHEAVLRYEYVLLHQDIAMGDAVQEGDTLRIGLFDDVHITARVSRADQHVPGVHSFRASFVLPDSGHVLVSVQDRVAAGTIEWWTTGRRFHLRFDPERQRHYVMEVDPLLEDRLPGGDPLEEW